MELRQLFLSFCSNKQLWRLYLPFVQKFLVFYLSQVTAQAQPILFYRFIIHVDYSSEFSTENQKLLDVSMSNLSSSADWTSKQTSLSENV